MYCYHNVEVTYVTTYVQTELSRNYINSSTPLLATQNITTIVSNNCWSSLTDFWWSHCIDTLFVGGVNTGVWKGLRCGNKGKITDKHEQIKWYIERVLLQFDHKSPTKPQLLPHKHCEIHHGAKVQVAPEEVDSPSLDVKIIKRVQYIVGVLLFYGKAVDKKC